MTEQRALTTLADELRAAFDRGFAEPPASEGQKRENLIAIEVRGEPYALRLSEIAGIHVDRTVTPLPSPARALLGVAGFRGRVVPVWDLGHIIGSSVAHGPSERPRWLFVTRVMEQSVAFAFDTFVRHFQVTANDIVPLAIEARDDVRRLVCSAAVLGDGVSDTRRPLVHVRALVDLVEQRLARPHGEAR